MKTNTLGAIFLTLLFASPSVYADEDIDICSPQTLKPIVENLNIIAEGFNVEHATDNCQFTLHTSYADQASFLTLPLVKLTQTSSATRTHVYPPAIAKLFNNSADYQQVDSYVEFIQLLNTKTNDAFITDYLTLTQINSEQTTQEFMQYVSAMSLPLWLQATHPVDFDTAEELRTEINGWNISNLITRNVNQTVRYWQEPTFWLIAAIALFVFVGYRYYLLALQSVTLDSKNYELDIKNQQLVATKQRLQQRNEQLEFLSTHDALTGLLNRDYFEQRVNDECNRATRGQHELSLILLDLDLFKDVNDRHGHSIGDKVLCDVAKELLHQLRSVDVIARWGGEEFIILLPDTPIHYAVDLAERLRLALAHLVIVPVGHISASFGVAQFNANETFAEVFNRADKALYQAKKTRNCVIASQFDLV